MDRYLENFQCNYSVEEIQIIMDSDNKNPIRVSNNGTCEYDMLDYMVTNCDTDPTYYPYDTQTCNLVIAAWGYSQNEIEFVSAATYSPFYKENGEWDLTGEDLEI